MCQPRVQTPSTGLPNASHFYVRAWALGCFYSHISTRTFRRALTASVDSCAEIECPVSGVTKSGRVWRNVPESDARSVPRVFSHVKPVLNWANVCSRNILRTLRRTMIRFLIELLVRRIWFGQSKLYFILNWLVMRCKLRPELAADAQQTA